MQNIITTLKEYLAEIQPLKDLNYHDKGNERQYELWRDKVRSFLELRFDKDSEERARFKGFRGAFYDVQKNTLVNLEAYETDLSSIIQRLEMRQELSVPVDGARSPVVPTAQNPTIFIAHGGRPPALKKLTDFLDALGIRPIIVEDEPSESRSVDDQVEWCLNQSDCAIVLATAEDREAGKIYARPNVQIEIGRFQERFPQKTIYLLEEGAQFPSNVSEKVWEHFTQDNMERAFLKVVRELRAFGYIHAGKTN